MAHFAELDESNVVVRVVVISNEDILDADGNESEQLGVDLCSRLFGGGNWKQTSYNGNFRRRYGGIGFTYDPDGDVFIEPPVFPSWILNDSYDWVAPVPEPEGDYEWNEETLSWVLRPTPEPAP